MENEKFFLVRLADNIINIINRLFNLFLISALFLAFADMIGNKKLYFLSVIISALSLIYIVQLSYSLYLKKDSKLISLNSLGFVLCIFLSSFFLTMTFSVSYLINSIAVNA